MNALLEYYNIIAGFSTISSIWSIICVTEDIKLMSTSSSLLPSNYLVAHCEISVNVIANVCWAKQPVISVADGIIRDVVVSVQ